MAMPTTKPELIKVLVEKYGYEKDKIDLFTNAKLQSMIKQEEIDAQQFEETYVKPKRRKETLINDNDMINIMCGTDSTYYISPQTGRDWDFREFGQQDTMEFRELKSMHNRYPVFLKEGWIVVLDKDVQEELKLTKLYENIVTPENIDNVFKKDVEELSVFIDNLPSGMKTTVAQKARELYEKGQFDSIKTKNLIEKKFNFSLDDNYSLNEVVKINKSE